MAEECKVCFMASEIKRMQDDIKDGKDISKDMAKVIADNNKETIKNIADIKETHTETKHIMEKIKDTQDAMATADKDSKAAMVISNKENRDLIMDGFKVIADKKAAEETKAELAKEKADAKAEALEIERVKDAKELLKEKRSGRRAMWLTLFTIGAGTLFGIIKQYAPQWLGIVVKN